MIVVGFCFVLFVFFFFLLWCGCLFICGEIGIRSVVFVCFGFCFCCFFFVLFLFFCCCSSHLNQKGIFIIIIIIIITTTTYFVCCNLYPLTFFGSSTWVPQLITGFLFCWFYVIAVVSIVIGSYCNLPNTSCHLVCLYLLLLLLLLFLLLLISLSFNLYLSISYCFTFRYCFSFFFILLYLW